VVGVEKHSFDSKAMWIHLLYDLVFIIAIIIASPYILYRCLTSQRFRAGLNHRLGFVPRRKGKGKAVWIHGVSVGEIKTVQPLLARLEQAYPDMEWALSTTTQAGYQIAQKLFPGKFIFYFPLDISFIVKKVIRRVDPCLIILMELEIWPNLLYEAERWGAPVTIVNGRISEKSYRGYRKLTRLLPEMDRISLFSVQNNEYRDRLLALKIAPDRIVVTGNIKYDGIDTSEAGERTYIMEALKLDPSVHLLVAGSTHSGEDDILLDLYQPLLKSHPGLRLLLAPRHLERVDEIEKACGRRNLTPVRRTRIQSKQGLIAAREVLILDTIGELDRVYGAADLVFVGGSLVPVGGHNMMEPAGKGKPVLYGPHVFNFTEDAALLERNNATLRVKDGAELATWIDRLLKDPEEADRFGRRARETISMAKGATERNFALLEDLFFKCYSK
jgi:3-deoxy-D-manno-octulosonic-acid transferase